MRLRTGFPWRLLRVLVTAMALGLAGGPRKTEDPEAENPIVWVVEAQDRQR